MGTLTVTATLSELATYESNGLKLYATPTTEGKVASTYWASSPSFRDDRVVATVYDFVEAEGYTSLGWQDMTEEEFDSVRDDVYTLEIPDQVGSDEDAELWEAEQAALAAEREACRAE